MKHLILILASSISFGASASDTYSNCTDATGIFEYLPSTQELIYNTNEVYDKSSYTVHFAGIKSATKGSCVANDGNTYDYENTQYTLKVTYLNGNSGAEELNCEEGFDALPAGLTCVTENSNGSTQSPVTAADIEEALITVCGDHSSTPAEVNACKEKIRDLCLDHTNTPEQNLSCILNNDAA